jgi:arylsulfatase B
MQHYVILAEEPWGLGLNEKLLPEYLKEEGYATHAIGKWHLGFFKKEYTPTYRGFDSHFGLWGSHQDYVDHTMKDVSSEHCIIYMELITPNKQSGPFVIRVF